MTSNKNDGAGGYQPEKTEQSSGMLKNAFNAGVSAAEDIHKRAFEIPLDMLEGMGVTTGIDMDKLLATTNEVATLLGRPPVGRVASALNAKRKRLGGS